MALFHQPVAKIQIAIVLGMSEPTFFRTLKRENITFTHKCRLSPKEAEDLVLKLGYDPLDAILIKRAKDVQHDSVIGFD
jgi:hypothetical protein